MVDLIRRLLSRNHFKIASHYYYTISPEEAEKFFKTLEKLQEEGFLQMKEKDGFTFIKGREWEEELIVKINDEGRIFFHNDFAGTFHITDKENRPIGISWRTTREDHLTPELFTLYLTLVALENAKVKSFFALPLPYSDMLSIQLAFSVVKKLQPASHIRTVNSSELFPSSSFFANIQVVEDDPFPYFDLNQLKSLINEKINNDTVPYYRLAAEEMEIDGRKLNDSEKMALIQLAHMKTTNGVNDKKLLPT